LQTASFLLSIVQIAVFIAELSIRGVAPLTINGGIGPWSDTMDWMGAKNAYKIYNGEIVNFFADQSDGQVAGQTPVANRVYSGAQPWRLFTSIFLHSGFIHIALNLTLQLRLALHAEVVWGMWRFVPIYFACGK
jgi:membrane associated rhomboid family serine protease